MKNPITSAVLRAAAKLEAWANSPHPIEPVLPQYKAYQVTGDIETFKDWVFENPQNETEILISDREKGEGIIMYKMMMK